MGILGTVFVAALLIAGWEANNEWGKVIMFILSIAIIGFVVEELKSW
jgi:hypothetical protein